MSLQSLPASTSILALLAFALGALNMIQRVRHLRTKAELRRARRNISLLSNERAEALRKKMLSAPPIRYSGPVQQAERPNLKLMTGA